MQKLNYCVKRNVIYRFIKYNKEKLRFMVLKHFYILNVLYNLHDNTVL